MIPRQVISNPFKLSQSTPTDSVFNTNRASCVTCPKQILEQFCRVQGSCCRAKSHAINICPRWLSFPTEGPRAHQQILLNEIPFAGPNRSIFFGTVGVLSGKIDSPKSWCWGTLRQWPINRWTFPSITTIIIIFYSTPQRQ